ncbi:carboxylate--amine ligase [Alloscardovia omnicolens]|uniref:carboxylate--amine ligase n=1 Tax=Alloscardovia omnicolens TaxID=419015 RepID=UPI003A621F1B
MNKAVVLGCNYYIGLSVIRCLGTQGVHVVACDYNLKKSYAARSKYVKEFLTVNTLNHFDDQACADLVAYGKKQSEKPVLFPTHDKYVEFIDTYYDQLSQYYLISQAADGLNSKVLDKWTLGELAQKHGVRIPQTISVSDEQLEEKVQSIGFPCMIKPVDTVVFTKVFRQKIFLCDNMETLREKIKACADHNIEVFVQELVPGFDDHMLTYDFYINREGTTTHYMTAHKFRQWPINFGASVFTEQKYDQRLVDIGKDFVEKIGYRGFGEIEFKEHEKTKEIYLIEINARTTNFNNLIYKVGLNMPYVAYLDVTGQLNETKYLTHDTNYAFIYALEDFFALRAYSKTKQLSFFKGFFQIFTKKLAPAIFAWSDLKPWFAFNVMIMGKVWRKITRR